MGVRDHDRVIILKREKENEKTNCERQHLSLIRIFKCVL